MCNRDNTEKNQSMSKDTEQETGEVLPNFLSIEQMQYTSCTSDILDDSQCEILGEYELDLDDRQNENVDIETIEEYPQKDIQNRTVSDNCDSSEDEDDTPESVEARLKKGCECKGYCLKDLNPEQVYKHRLNIAELTKNEHDMYLMGVTMACAANIKKTSRQKDRQRQRATYVYQGKRVCLDAFLFLENVTQYHIKRIRSHVLKHGVIPRVHGNLGKKPHNTFSLDMYKNLEDYIKKYLKPHVTDPQKNQIIYGITRADIYNSYKDHGRKSDEKLMGYSTFRRFMKKQFPNIKFQKIDHSGKHVSFETPKKKLKVTNKNEPKKRVGARIPVAVQQPAQMETTYIITPVKIESTFIEIDEDQTIYTIS